MKKTNSPLGNQKKRASQRVPKTPIQLELKSFSHGGRRKNSGRKKAPKGQQKVPHRTRELIKSKFPFHVNVRFKVNPYLRSKHPYAIFRGAVGRAKKFGLRVLQFHLLGNHYHLQCEADSSSAVTQAIRSINSSLAKLLGTKVQERYHIEINRTPAEVRNTLAYIFANAAKHFQRTKVFDYFSSFPTFDDEKALKALARLRKDLDWRQPKIAAQILMEYAEALSPARSWLACKGWMLAFRY